jgi:hypothetical protein
VEMDRIDTGFGVDSASCSIKERFSHHLRNE